MWVPGWVLHSGRIQTAVGCADPDLIYAGGLQVVQSSVQSREEGLLGSHVLGTEQGLGSLLSPVMPSLRPLPCFPQKQAVGGHFGGGSGHHHGLRRFVSE